MSRRAASAGVARGSRLGVTRVEGTRLNAEISGLERTLLELLSIASFPTSTQLSAGTCNFGGALNTTVLDFSYNSVEVSGVVYYFYRFSQQDVNVTVEIDNTGFSISGCSPGIYLGPMGNAQVPLLATQADKFDGTAVQFIEGMKAGNNELMFFTSAFGGTRTLKLKANETLTHFVSIF